MSARGFRDEILFAALASFAVIIVYPATRALAGSVLAGFLVVGVVAAAYLYRIARCSRRRDGYLVVIASSTIGAVVFALVPVLGFELFVIFQVIALWLVRASQGRRASPQPGCVACRAEGARAYGIGVLTVRL